MAAHEADTTNVHGITNTANLQPLRTLLTRIGVVTAETLSGAKILVAADIQAAEIWAVDPGGASRNVDLPVTTVLAGYKFLIVNTADAAETLTVRLTAGGATVCTIDQGEHALVTCYAATAGAWVGMVSKNT